jgi:hypothetical protein
MTVKELKEMLNDYPDDMDVLNTRCSDYELVDIKDWSVVEALPKEFWYMRAHPTMKPEYQYEKKKCLLLEGS